MGGFNTSGSYGIVNTVYLFNTSNTFALLGVFRRCNNINNLHMLNAVHALNMLSTFNNFTNLNLLNTSNTSNILVERRPNLGQIWADLGATRGELRAIFGQFGPARIDFDASGEAEG